MLVQYFLRIGKQGVHHLNRRCHAFFREYRCIRIPESTGILVQAVYATVNPEFLVTGYKPLGVSYDGIVLVDCIAFGCRTRGRHR